MNGFKCFYGPGSDQHIYISEKSDKPEFGGKVSDWTSPRRLNFIGRYLYGEFDIQTFGRAEYAGRKGYREVRYAASWASIVGEVRMQGFIGVLDDIIWAVKSLTIG